MSGGSATAIGGGAVSGALSGAVAGSAGGPWGILIGAIVGAALGAGLSAAAIALAPGPAKSPKHKTDEIFSQSQRNTPIPIVFGRNRLGGNCIALGCFLKTGDRLGKASPGRKLMHVNEVLALAEGPLQVVGNLYQDRSLTQNLRTAEKQPQAAYEFYWYAGTPTDAIPQRVSEPVSAYLETPLVPWRNTAKIVVRTIVGENPRLIDINVDTVGPDLTLRYQKTTADPNPGDTCLMVNYDAHIESFCYTISASGIDSAPFGLIVQGRGNHPRRYHTQPPTAVSTSVTKAWYLGRHDVLVMADPVTTGVFWIGYGGMARSSPDWERHTPDPGYSNAMIFNHLDELHGILHSLHSNGSTMYVMRWTLLTGRIERLEITGITSGTFMSFMYSPDRDQYLITKYPSNIYFVNPRTGDIEGNITSIDTHFLDGLCVSGEFVGLFQRSALAYYHYAGRRTIGPYGSSSADIAPGCLGCNYWTQNTWTGHVTLAKSFGGSSAFVNFIPSVVEDIEDLSCNGTPKSKAHPAGEFQTYIVDPVAGWVRDWSCRTYNKIKMTQLQGNSSLAASMWSLLFDVRANDSARWGAGLPAQYAGQEIGFRNYGNISSFESVHAFCVGGRVSITNRALKGKSRTYTSEMAKCDFSIDNESSASDVIASTMLTSIDGYRRVVDGQLQVGVLRRGILPVWHWTDEQTEDGKGVLSYLGRAEGINRVRCQYTSVRDEYRKDWAEANDEYEQNRMSRVHMRSITINSIASKGHAQWLCQHLLDYATASRRQVSFSTHFLGYLMVPGDPVEVSQSALGLVKMPGIVHSLSEDNQKDFKITVVEHPVLRTQMSTAVRTGIGPDDGTDIGFEPDCAMQSGPTDGTNTTVFWFNQGNTFNAGDYTLEYVGGAYAPASDGSWTNAVVGYDLVARSGTNIVTVVAAPGVSITAPGWASQDLAENANSGQITNVGLSNSTALGLRIGTGLAAFESPDSSTPPIYRVCVVGSSPTGGGGGGGGGTGGDSGGGGFGGDGGGGGGGLGGGDDGSCPLTKTFTISGAIGPDAVFNGAHTLTWDGSQWSLPYAPGGEYAIWSGSGAWFAAAPANLAYAIASSDPCPANGVYPIQGGGAVGTTGSVS